MTINSQTHELYALLRREGRAVTQRCLACGYVRPDLRDPCPCGVHRSEPEVSNHMRVGVK